MAHGDHAGHGHMGHDLHGDAAGHEGHTGHMLTKILTSTVAAIVDPQNSIGSGVDYIDHSSHHGIDHAHMHDTSFRKGMNMEGGDEGGHEGHHGGGHDDMGHNMHNMMMWFHGGYNEIVLFESWKFNTVGGLIGSMIGIFFMAALYEGLKYYREYLFWKTYSALQYRSVAMPSEKNVVAEDNSVVHVVGEMIHKQPPSMFSWMHGFQTCLHIIQMVLSYFLMLIFMTYNIWLCVAVVLGAAVGYFLFGWKKSVIVDVTEHCH